MHDVTDAVPARRATIHAASLEARQRATPCEGTAAWPTIYSSVVTASQPLPGVRKDLLLPAEQPLHPPHGRQEEPEGDGTEEGARAQLAAPAPDPDVVGHEAHRAG